MWRFLGLAGLAAVAGLAAFWFVTRPRMLPATAMDGLTPDLARGELIFWAAGCASCHIAPEAEGGDKLRLGGGQRFPTAFGTFVAPNISPDPTQGIGGWSALDLANAMTRGVSPKGTHYYPVFPYVSYANMALQDVADLHAYLVTLPPVATPSQPQDVAFPFSIRRLLGGWKFLYLGRGWVLPDAGLSDAERRGRYLVEGAGHCAECHTPRGALGGMDRSRWLSGAPVPGATGRFPNITPGKLTWSAADIAEFLNSGFTPEFDSAGGKMALVVENMARLPPEDRAAIAAYLKKVPAVP